MARGCQPPAAACMQCHPLIMILLAYSTESIACIDDYVSKSSTREDVLAGVGEGDARSMQSQLGMSLFAYNRFCPLVLN